ncbi:uridine nucleosidase 1-like [Colias croceus]|uniref:uridine nucleosidase 1-like n=1 Tax=Colias crocea TaxID=72248 RepID=UPI001E27BE0F|nr:uridine nucleosidase 1-like [Colias croceus]
MAIFMALLNEKHFDGPKVVGITTVHGNVNEPQVFENTQRILDIADRRDVPIYRGCQSALMKDYPTDGYFGHDGLGDNSTKSFKPIKAKSDYASVAMSKLSKKYKDKLTIVTLGPLTNMAVAIKLDPGLLARIWQLYVAAGNIYTNGMKLEFNVKMDIEGYFVVIHNGLADKLTLIPSKVKKSLNLGRQWRKDTFGEIKSDIVRSLNIFERISLPKTNDWAPLDPVAMSIVLDSSIIKELKFTLNGIFLCGNSKGRNTNDFKSKSPKQRLVFSCNKEPFREFLMKIFSADDNKHDRDENDDSHDHHHGHHHDHHHHHHDDSDDDD